MSLSPFGALLLIIILVTIYKYRTIESLFINVLSLSIIIETFINTGYWINIGGYELTYSEGLILILCFFSLIILLKKPVDRKVLLIGMLLFSVIIISSLLLLLFPLDYPIITYGMSWNEYFANNTVTPLFSIQTLLMSLRMVIFVLLTIASIVVLTKKEVNNMIERFIKSGLFVCSFVFIEFLIKNIFKSNVLQTYISWFFGSGGSTLDVLLVRGDLFSLQGFMREPSYLALSLFWFGIVWVFARYNMRNFSVVFFGIFVLMLLTRSFSAVLYIFGLYIIYATVSNKKVVYSIITLVFGIIFALTDLSKYYSERLINTIEVLKSPSIAKITSSEDIRMLSITENIKVLIKRPLFGAGLGTSYAFGAIPSLVSNLGIIGLFVFLTFIFKVVAKMKMNINSIIIISALVMSWFFAGDLGIIYSMPLLFVIIILRFYNKGELSNENIANNN